MFSKHVVAFREKLIYVSVDAVTFDVCKQMSCRKHENIFKLFALWMHDTDTFLRLRILKTAVYRATTHNHFKDKILKIKRFIQKNVRLKYQFLASVNWYTILGFYNFRMKAFPNLECIQNTCRNSHLVGRCIFNCCWEWNQI